MIAPVSVCHQVSTIPDPGLGVDRFADAAEHAQRREVEVIRNLSPELHERPDGGGRGVEDGHAVLLDDLPPAPAVGRVRRALVEHLGRPVGQRTVDDVAVTGDPADIGGAPIDVGLGVQVEHVLMGEGRLGEVAAARVEDALRLAGRARGVEDEQRVLRRESLGLVLGVDAGHRLVPPQVAALDPVHLVLAAFDHQHVFDRVLALLGEGGIHGGLEGADLALAPAAVGGDHELGVRIVHPRSDAFGAEAAEDHRVHGADAGHREHRDDGLGDHRKVDRHPVSPLDPELHQEIRRPLHLGGELRVGDVPAVAGLALPVQGDAVAVAGEHVAVEAVVGDVELAILEPGGERRVRPIEILREVRVPVQQLAGLPRPEREPVGGGLVVQRRGRDRGGDEFGTRREASFLVLQAVD
jgi:hypothetical protein